MAKIYVLGPRELREAILDRLQDLGAVQLLDVAGDARRDEELKSLHQHFEPETRELRLQIAKAEFIMALLERAEGSRAGLVSGFLKEKFHLSYEQFLNLEKDFDLDGAYRELEEADIALRQAESKAADLKEDIAAMIPWRALDIAFTDLDEVKSVSLRLFIAGPAKLESLLEQVAQRCPYSCFEEISREKEAVYLAALIHEEDLQEFYVVVSESGAESVQFPGKSGTVSAEMEAAEEALRAAVDNKKSIEERIKEKIPLKGQVCALNDYYNNQLAKEEAKGRCIHTERTIALEGWVEESQAEVIKESLKGFGQTVYAFIEPPDEDEVPPTKLVNRRRIRPAETLTQLFGWPEHSETDPTPLVAPFFIIFFAMCIGDVGYGIILALAFWLAIRRLEVSSNAKKFFRLFMYCGMATIIAGIVTRGYFGIDGESLPGFLKFPGTMDILNNPVPIMLICSALGLMHISIGVAIEMRDNMRNNSTWLGICEQGTTLLFWFGIAVLAVGYGARVRIMGLAGTYLMITGILGIIFLSNIAAKSVAGKFFGGLYNMYGLIAGTIGDVASYLRLYALGLATIAIGSVVNRMALMTWGIPVLGVVFLIVILLGGHLFNLAINFLGAFVHPLRLQYVEFFGKFYEDGGEPFEPLAIRTNKTVIDDL
jgi:V/A-type H+-transporting ATPase subunit I